MKSFLKIFVLVLITAAALAAAAGLFPKTLYYRDYALSFYYELLSRESVPRAGFTVIDPEKRARLALTYKALPGNFIHSGQSLLFTANEEIRVKDLAERAIEYTDYFHAGSLASAIKKQNGYGDAIPGGSVVIIPASLPPVTTDPTNLTKPEIIYTRGLYFTGHSAGSGRLLRSIPKFRMIGINTVVFDAKDVTGIVNYRSRVPEVVRYDSHRGRTIDNITKLIRELKANGIYTIARVAVFQDHLLVKREPSLSIQSRRTGGVWNAGRNELWCDPTSRTVQDYNIKLAVELAGLGVDEVQFDYIRFPTEGDLADARFRYDFGAMKNDEVIARFLKKAQAEIAKRNANLSIDIFGVVAWGKEIDIRRTGQRIELLSRYCDVISPMLYPSHFNDDFDGYARPGDNPYYFIHTGCLKVVEKSRKGTIVRPWLQAFTWRVSNYDKRYILEQVRASDDSGSRGYLFWNASNEYETVISALSGVDQARNTARLEPPQAGGPAVTDDSKAL